MKNIIRQIEFIAIEAIMKEMASLVSIISNLPFANKNQFQRLFNIRRLDELRGEISIYFEQNQDSECASRLIKLLNLFLSGGSFIDAIIKYGDLTIVFNFDEINQLGKQLISKLDSVLGLWKGSIVLKSTPVRDAVYKYSKSKSKFSKEELERIAYDNSGETCDKILKAISLMSLTRDMDEKSKLVISDAVSKSILAHYEKGVRFDLDKLVDDLVELTTNEYSNDDFERFVTKSGKAISRIRRRKGLTNDELKQASSLIILEKGNTKLFSGKAKSWKDVQKGLEFAVLGHFLVKKK